MYDFVAQLLHYFDRPANGPATAAVGGPTAWRGADLAVERCWQECLAPEQIDDLGAAAVRIVASGIPLVDLDPATEPLASVQDAIGRWRRELDGGRGFVLVRHLPVHEWSVAEAEAAFWLLGCHLGTPGAQNLDGDLLGHVTDLSAAAGHDDERLYRTNRSIRFHCDAADVVGLLCLASSPRGGASRLVSSTTVFDHVVGARADLAARLFEPFLLDARRPPSDGLQYTPVAPCAFDGERLRTFMHLDYFTSVERHPGVTLDDRAHQVLAEWEDYAERPDVHLDMQLEPGDLQLVSNHSVVHARTAYTDDPAAPRHLLRLWLSLA